MSTATVTRPGYQWWNDANAGLLKLVKEQTDEGCGLRARAAMKLINKNFERVRGGHRPPAGESGESGCLRRPGIPGIRG